MGMLHEQRKDFHEFNKFSPSILPFHHNYIYIYIK